MRVEDRVREIVADTMRAYGRIDILVNAVCPGIVDTPMIRNLAAAEGRPAEDYLAPQLIKRFQTPQDIAYAMAYLHTSRAMTGQALNIDGGTFFH